MTIIKDQPSKKKKTNRKTPVEIRDTPTAKTAKSLNFSRTKDKVEAICVCSKC